MEEYLRCSEIIDCYTESIRTRAQALTEGLESAQDKAVALFYFVRDQIKFNSYAAGENLDYNKASVILEKGNGFCYQKAIVLVAMARATGIPARLGFADIRNHLLSEKFREKMFGSNILVYHGWAELYIDGKWVRATPAYDIEMCLENSFIPVDFDGVNDARLHSHTEDGRMHIEYIREHGHYDDLPWAEILNAHGELLAELGVDRDTFMAKWTEEPQG
ncbi:MAG: transglutaminase domain-containing protein [Dehalococcoidia bacterium]|nr:MAG: transglutaminase domain-containing protein [Dehalococcoidia bacterium]